MKEGDQPTKADKRAEIFAPLQTAAFDLDPTRLRKLANAIKQPA